MSNTPICEVRVITHKRPAWLRRSLESLRSQTCPYWIAYVYDDSPQCEAEEVVRKMKDPRIHYLPNKSNFGAAANLDQGFSVSSRSVAQFACILEDDNWLLPDFIQENVSALRQFGGNLLMRNQCIADQRDFSAEYEMTARTTLEPWYSEGVISPFEIHARMLLMQGVSNGGLFWRLNGKSRLQVGKLVTDSGLQEFCRSWQINEPIWVAMKPLAVWSRTHVGTQHYTKSMIRSSTRGFQAVRQVLRREHGHALVTEALSLVPQSHLRACSHGLAMTAPPNLRLLRMFGPVYLRDWFFSCLRAHMIKNPLNEYIQSMT